jgi:hypothetical protein
MMTQVNPVLALWLPALFMVLAIWVGLIYNNKRFDDFKDLLRSEVGRSEERILARITQIELQIRADVHTEVSHATAELKADIQTLDCRVQRLEAPLLRG